MIPTCMCVYEYVHVCAYICMYMYACVHMYVCICVCAYMYVCACVCLCVCAYVCVHMCMCVCVYPLPKCRDVMVFSCSFIAPAPRTSPQVCSLNNCGKNCLIHTCTHLHTRTHTFNSSRSFPTTSVINMGRSLAH